MAFLDRFKTKNTLPVPIDPKSNVEVGISSSTLYGPSDFRKYNPDDLQYNKGAEVYKRMLKDDQVKAVMLFKQYAIVSRNWYFDIEQDESGNNKTQHEEIADFFEHVIRVMKGSFIDKLIEILSALKHGFSICEKIYEEIQYDSKTYWGVKDIKLRPFYTFNNGIKIDKHGNILEIAQTDIGEEVIIPLEKIIHFVHQPDVDRHYGESDLKSAYRSWWSKDICIKFQNIHLERHAGGFLWAQVEGSLTPTQKNDLQDLITNVSAHMGAMVPKTVELNAFNPMRTDAFDKAIAQHDKAIAKSLLVPNLLGLSEQGQTGSYSQSQTQMDAFFWVLDAIANRLSEALNEQLFRDLAMWNFGTDDFPWFKFQPMTDEMKMQIAKDWNELVKGGSVTKTESDEAYLRNLTGFPEKSEEMPIEDNEPVDIPDLEDWINEKDDQNFIRKELKEKAWTRRVNFVKLERNFDKADKKLSDEMSNIMATVRLSLESQIARMIGERSMGNVKPKEIDSIKVPSKSMTELRSTLRSDLSSVLNSSYESARRELPRRKFKRIQPGMDKTQSEKFINSKAMKVANVIDQDTLKAIQNILYNGIKYDKTLKEIMLAIAEDTALMALLPEVDAAGRAINYPARIENIARTNIADAVNQGRQALFTEPGLRGFVQAFEYSAIMDARTTEICQHLHGKILKDFGVSVPPNHYQCRSILVPVTQIDRESGEWNGKESAPPRLQPQKGFG